MVGYIWNRYLQSIGSFSSWPSFRPAPRAARAALWSKCYQASFAGPRSRRQPSINSLGHTIWLWHSQFAMENHHAINRGKVNHLFRLGPSIPWLCYLYHGYVSHNQRVTLVCWLEATPWTNPVWPQQPPVLHGFRPLFEVEKPWKLRSDRSVQRINMDKPAGASHWLAKLSIHLASHLPSYSMIFTFLFWCCICI